SAIEIIGTFLSRRECEITDPKRSLPNDVAKLPKVSVHCRILYSFLLLLPRFCGSLLRLGALAPFLFALVGEVLTGHSACGWNDRADRRLYFSLVRLAVISLGDRDLGR